MGGRCYVSVVKRQKLDAAIDAASASVAEGKSLVQVFMIQEAVRREAEKEEKRLEREGYEAEKEERRLERERRERRDVEDREERRLDRLRAAERERSHDMLMMSLFAKIFDSKRDI